MPGLTEVPWGHQKTAGYGKGLLEGTGKLLCHIKIRSLEDLRRPAVKRLVARASNHLPKLKR